MLCPNVRERVIMGHDVCEATGVIATVCADFVDGVIFSLSVSCQCSVMSATKTAKVYSVRSLVGCTSPGTQEKLCRLVSLEYAKEES